ncbi:MAG: hypothetical protein Q8M06_04065 [Methanobacteriaceae archaeon]|nr:hypothetical protein [Methanobacteriaceae archaeon]
MLTICLQRKSVNNMLTGFSVVFESVTLPTLEIFGIFGLVSSVNLPKIYIEFFC